jgi:hypothetical protein
MGPKKSAKGKGAAPENGGEMVKSDCHLTNYLFIYCLVGWLVVDSAYGMIRISPCRLVIALPLTCCMPFFL